jgi:hypothetical protein
MVLVECEIQPSDVETGEIDAVVNSVVIRIIFGECIVPSFKPMAEQQIQF